MRPERRYSPAHPITHRDALRTSYHVAQRHTMSRPVTPRHTLPHTNATPYFSMTSKRALEYSATTAVRIARRTSEHKNLCAQRTGTPVNTSARTTIELLYCMRPREDNEQCKTLLSKNKNRVRYTRKGIPGIPLRKNDSNGYSLGWLVQEREKQSHYNRLQNTCPSLSIFFFNT